MPPVRRENDHRDPSPRSSLLDEGDSGSEGPQDGTEGVRRLSWHSAAYEAATPGGRRPLSAEPQSRSVGAVPHLLQGQRSRLGSRSATAQGSRIRHQPQFR
ncbi:hypothetical protein NDU88_003879 [Pleurodeles waltl]|uniref:Uncharacterized protein n=1 Tax=Pleurodeles waltl TaxID=8319 RepID=A0AAV7NKP7_PLEWA|nr:hypothetical protein NDU88_003879 [Pleurodeles waltl]